MQILGKTSICYASNYLILVLWCIRWFNFGGTVKAMLNRVKKNPETCEKFAIHTVKVLGTGVQNFL